MNKEETISAYIKKLLDIQDDQLTEGHLKELAIELGLSDEEYEELQDLYADHMTRGKGFYELQNWDDAIDEFQQALALNPLQPDSLMAQAEAYKGKWLESKQDSHRKEAIFHAKRALKYNPDLDEAAKFITDIRKESASKKPSFRTVALMSALGLLVLTIMIWNNISDSSSENPAPSNTNNQAPLSSANPLPKNAEYQEFNQLDIPIRFYSQRAEQLEFIPKTSLVTDVTAKHMYKFQGWIKPKENGIKTLRLSFEMTLKDGSKWFETVHRIHDRPATSAQKGDLMPIGFGKVINSARPENISEVRVRVAEISFESTPEALKEAEPLEISWGIPHLDEMKIDVKSRAQRFLQSGSQLYFTIEYEVTNTGTVPFTTLEFLAKWYDSDSNIVFSGNQFIVASMTPPLEPGMTYVIARTFGLKDVSKDQLKTLTTTVVRAK